MLTAVVLIVGSVVVWLLVDHGLSWLRERQDGGPSSWRGSGPGTTFHSSGFEDTIPPHEVVEPPRAAMLRRR